MKKKLMNNTNIIVSFIGSVITIMTFIGSHFGIKLPKIEIDLNYLYLTYGKYMFVMFFSLFVISIFNTIYQIKIYNDKTEKKYNELIQYFQNIILDNDIFAYKRLAKMILDLYPYRNKSKINLVIRWKDTQNKYGYRNIYDTLNYEEWMSKRGNWRFWLRRFFKKKSYNWKVDRKLFMKNKFLLFINNKGSSIGYVCLYGNRNAFKKKRKKVFERYTETIEKFLYIVLQNNPSITE